ncbi:MAG: glycosyl hydrolase family 18 protein [Cytophagaceae bacterium]
MKSVKPNVLFLSLVAVLIFSFSSIAQPPNKRVVGYFMSDIYGDRSDIVNPSSIDYSKYSMINYGFFIPQSDGTLLSANSSADAFFIDPSLSTSNSLVKSAHANGVPVLLTIGGAGRSSNFSTTAASYRSVFAVQCTTQVDNYQLDGIDIDWEFPGSGDGAHFTSLLQEVRDKLDIYGGLHSKSFYLSIAVGTDVSELQYIEWGNILPLVDMINVMGYNYTGAISGYNAPLGGTTSIDATIDYILAQGVPAEKLNLITPFYGKTFKPCTALGCTATVFSNPDYYDTYHDLTAPTNYSITAGSSPEYEPIAIDNTNQIFLSYEDATSIGWKAQYVLDNNLGGSGMWHIANDYLTTTQGPTFTMVSSTNNLPLAKAIYNKFSTVSNYSLSFDGINDRVVVPHHTSYDRGTSDYAIEGWVKLSNVINPNGNWTPFFSNRTTSTNGVLFSASNDGTQLLLTMNGSTYSSNQFPTINDQSWHHIAVSRTSTATKYYLDGYCVGNSGSTSNITTSGSVYIGYDNVGGMALSGIVDQIRFWSTGLTESSISTYLNSAIPGSTSNLIGLWNFTENNGQTVTDGSNNANHGKLGINLYGSVYTPDAADPIRTSSAATIAVDAGYTFDGSDDRITIPYHSNYNGSTSQNFSLEAQIKFSNGVLNSGQKVIASHRSSGSEGFLFAVKTVTGGYQIVLQIAGITSTSSTTTTSLYDNNCHHIAVSRDASTNTVSFYLDGSALGTATNSSSRNSFASLYIGYDASTISPTPAGNINEFRFWKSVRTSTEISSNKTSIFDNTTANLVGYWRLKETAGYQVADLSGTNSYGNMGYLGTSSTGDSYEPTRSASSCYTLDRMAISVNNLSSDMASENIDIYPNPFTNEISFDKKNIELSNAVITICDLNGLIVFKSAFVEKINLDDRIPSGLYIVKIADDNTVRSYKLIKK